MAAGTIVVDGIFFKLANTGIARIWRELLTRWQHQPFGSRLVVIDRDRSLPPLHGIRTVRCAMPDMAQWKDDQDLVQKVCDSADARVFISSYYTRPSRTPSVMMVYDMIPERLAGFDLSDPTWRQKHDSIHHAAAFACISNNTRSDLVATFPEIGDKPNIVVTPGVGAPFSPATDHELQEFRTRFVDRHLGGRRYLLFIGLPNIYKNGALLAQALRGMWRWRRRRYAVLFSAHDPLVTELQGQNDLVVHAESLSDTDLRLAYGVAECLVYPSLYEGFGLPPLEAMACGCPVICSAAGALPEAVGDAALIIDPKDEATLRAALRHVRRPAVRKQLRERGLERARMFSWDAMANRMAGFLSDMAAGSSPRP